MNPFSQQAVDRYSATIELIQTNYPSIVVIDPSPFSPHTYRCRLRDAIKAIYTGMATMRKIDWDRDKFNSWAEKYSISLKGEQLHIGPREELRKANQVMGSIGTALKADFLPPSDGFDGLNEEVVSALCTLLKEGTIDDFLLRGTTEEAVKTFLSQTDHNFETVKSKTGITVF